MLKIKNKLKFKIFVLFLGFFITASINSSFLAASRHLYRIEDEHNHPLNCPLREFLDIIAVSFALGAVILIIRAVKRLKFKKRYLSFIRPAIHLPLCRAPPSI